MHDRIVNLVILERSSIKSTRPIYNIAHMVNSVAQIDQWLGYGANALEVDVKFADDGTPSYFSHGIPCDVGRDCLRWAYIGNYVQALRERSHPNSQKFNSALVLVMFDVKLTKLNQNVLSNAGVRFAENILIPLYENNPTKMKIMISVPNLTLKDFISGVINHLKTARSGILEKIGFEISWEEEFKKPSQKEEQLRGLGITPGHAWLSSGISSIVASLYLEELKGQVAYRDRGNYFSKVYTWTVDKKSTAIKYLNINLDGMITNYPGRVNEAIKEVNQKNGPGEKVRLATLDDDPFRIII